MAVEFVLGTARSKRDDYVFEKAGKLYKEDPFRRILFFAPAQATYITEKKLMRKLRVPGLMNIEVASPGRLAGRILSTVYGKAASKLSPVGKAMMMRRLLDENAERLQSLSKTARNKDFPEQLASLAAKLKSWDITPEMLAALQTDYESTNAKFADISAIYRLFTERTEFLFDNEDQTDLAIEHIKEAPFLRNVQLFVHGFDTYSPQTVRFITELMRVAEDTTMSFYYADKNAPDAFLYDLCGRNQAKFLRAAGELGLKTTIVKEDRPISPDILHLSKNLFALPHQTQKCGGGIAVFSAESIEEEVRALGACIARLKEQDAYDFKDMAVVYGSADYLPVIKQYFSRADIPYFSGEKRTLDECTFSSFLLSALNLSQGKLSKETLLTHADSGFCNISRRQADILKNYAFSHIHSGFAFEKEFDDKNAEEARTLLMEPISELRERARKAKNAGEYIDAVLWYLKKLNVEDKCANQAGTAAEHGLLQEREWNSQVYGAAVTMLQQAKDILPDAPIDKRNMAAVIEAGLHSQKINIIPPGANEVAVGDVSYLSERLDEPKVVFVTGANAGVFPDYSEKSDILTDYEQQILAQTFEGAGSTDTVGLERLMIEKILSAPKNRLFISYLETGEKEPSPVIRTLERIFEGIPRDSARRLLTDLRQNAFLFTVQTLRALKDGECVDLTVDDRRTIAAALGDPALSAPVNRALKRLAYENAARPLSKERAEELYRERPNVSASRINDYYICPYKQFISYGIRADDPKEYRVGALDIGNYAHALLQELTEEFMKNGESWGEIGEGELRERFERVSASVRERTEKYGVSPQNAFALGLIEREVWESVRIIKEQLSSSLFVPAAAEQKFKLDLGDGVTLTGKIDRIDKAVVGDVTYCQILDYKTGEDKVDYADILNGLKMQLVIYLLALEKMMPGADGVRSAYFNIKMPYAEDGQPPKAGGSGVVTDEDEGATLKMLYGIGTNEKGKCEIKSVNIELKKNGTPNKLYTPAKKLVQREQGKVLTEYVRMKLKQAAAGIISGDNRISPLKKEKKEGDPCVWCDFKNICMIDEGYEGNEKRIYEKPGVAALNVMGKELSDAAE